MRSLYDNCLNIFVAYQSNTPMSRVTLPRSGCCWHIAGHGLLQITTWTNKQKNDTGTPAASTRKHYLEHMWFHGTRQMNDARRVLRSPTSSVLLRKARRCTRQQAAFSSHTIHFSEVSKNNLPPKTNCSLSLKLSNNTTLHLGCSSSFHVWFNRRILIVLYTHPSTYKINSFYENCS